MRAPAPDASNLPHEGASSSPSGGWLSRFLGWRGPERGSVVLHYRRVFILPTRYGLLFGVALLAMLLGAINYQLSLGYALTFFTASVAVVGMLSTFRNLAGLKLRMIETPAVFAGAPACLGIALENAVHPRTRWRLRIAAANSSTRHLRRKGGLSSQPLNDPVFLPAFFDVGADSPASLIVSVPTHQRGLMPLPRLRIDSVFPLGLWRAWAYWHPAGQVVVYPAPEVQPPSLPAPGALEAEGAWRGLGQEEFAGLRDYQPGDALRRIAWRRAARDEAGLLVKRFDGAQSQRLMLDWQQLQGLDTEARASRLCAWILEAEARHLQYGLILPDRRVDYGQGFDHRERCLYALAAMPHPAAS